MLANKYSTNLEKYTGSTGTGEIEDESEYECEQSERITRESLSPGIQSSDGENSENDESEDEVVKPPSCKGQRFPEDESEDPTGPGSNEAALNKQPGGTEQLIIINEQRRDVYNEVELHDRDLPDGVYYVEEIKGMRSTYKNGEDYYVVKWRNFDNRFNKLEPLSSLQHCLHLINNFRVNKLQLEPLPYPNDLGGAVSFSDTRNYASVKLLLDLVTRHIKHSKIATNGLELTNDFPAKRPSDTLFIFKHGHHIFVVLYLVKHHQAFVGDGLNCHLNDKTGAARPDLRTLDKEVVGISYRYPTRVDFCASAAAVLAVHFAKARNTGVFNECRPSTNDRVYFEKHLHTNQPGRSIAQVDWHNLRRTNQRECPYCGKSKKPAGLASHMRACKSKS